MIGNSLFDDLQRIPDVASDVFQKSQRGSAFVGCSGIRSVVIAGVGEAALAAELFAASVRDVLTAPVLVCSEPTLPAYAGRDTLVVVLSASGDAEEPVQVLSDAAERGASIAVIAGGGRLIEMADAQEFPQVRLPEEALAPTIELAALFFALWGGFSSAFIPVDLRLMDGETQANQTLGLLRRQRRAFAPEQSADSNPARQLSAALEDTTPVVFGNGEIGAAAARAWRSRFRTVAERFALYDELPSPLGYLNAGPAAHIAGGADFTGIVLHEGEETPTLTRQAEVAAREMSGPCHQISLDGETALERLWGAVYLADWAAFYSAR
ncbi:MAG: Bifunctional phosphoglucose/phosphomannose isomerase [Capsulimonas sp.]|nr:Bifunctional phosphoglucose/phosphomannose isomerase [Capsulimonas sp.]